jgi:putative membrane protein
MRPGQVTRFARDFRRSPGVVVATTQKRMRFLLPVVIFAIAGFAIDRAEQHGDTGFVHDKADQAFVQSAIGNLLADAEWSEVAALYAEAPSVRTFARLAVNQQGGTLRELRVLASARSIPVLARLEDEHRDERDRLVSAHGAALDRAYIVAMIRLRQGTVALFEHQAATGLDPELRSWAAARLVEIRDQLQQVRTLP